MGKLKTQARVIFALMLREMTTRFGSSSGGYLWALLEPVGAIALLVVIFTQIAHTPPMGRSFALFYATGYLAFAFWNDIAAITARSVHVNRPLLAYPAVTPLDTILARFVLQALTGLCAAAVIFGATLAFFAEQARLDLSSLMAAFGFAALLGLGTGLLNALLFAMSKSWELAYGILSRPLFLVSCVFFSFASMPRFVQEVLWFNPIVHIVGLMRAGFYPVYDAAHVSPAYLGFLGLGMVAAGLFGLRRYPQRLVEA